jgi:8-oxo-dGTP pyrophosphatase MutT (NUDIX family)
LEPRIRILALALIRRGDRILVEKGRDETKDETFFRLLGGTVEFGETGANTLRRELREELAADADVGRLVATIENLFTYEGEAAHEICLVYECSLRDERLYELDEWDAHEETASGVVTHPVSWREIDSFGTGPDILYPEDLLELLVSRK